MVHASALFWFCVTVIHSERALESLVDGSSGKYLIVMSWFLFTVRGKVLSEGRRVIKEEGVTSQETLTRTSHRFARLGSQSYVFHMQSKKWQTNKLFIRQKNIYWISRTLLLLAHSYVAMKKILPRKDQIGLPLKNFFTPANTEGVVIQTWESSFKCQRC